MTALKHRKYLLILKKEEKVWMILKALKLGI